MAIFILTWPFSLENIFSNPSFDILLQSTLGDTVSNLAGRGSNEMKLQVHLTHCTSATQSELPDSIVPSVTQKLNFPHCCRLPDLTD